MSSIIFRHLGGLLGGSLAGPLGQALGSALGSHLGAELEQRLFGSRRRNNHISGRLTDLAIQTSSYGCPIPIIYGSCKIAGNIIWALPIKEHIRADHYHYTATLAIALCQGPINQLLRAWADVQMLNLAELSYRLYIGDETQLPDPLIEKVMGIGNTPAYRGLAYIVIEDFPLAEFANRIPNFSFEVKKSFKNGLAVEDLIQAITIIPGSGEFVYDTDIQYKVYGYHDEGKWVQQGKRSAINASNGSTRADALLSLDQLQEDCKNLKFVSVVVSWFTTSLDIKDAYIRPGVEYQTGSTTEPDEWQVAGLSRNHAYPISHDKNGNPTYGGTSNDLSLLKFIEALKGKGYQVMLVPMILIDLPGKPWRGRLTGQADDLNEFFNKTSGYNQFILHYAELVKDKVDAFVIGSELPGLTKLHNEAHQFPAVNELLKLASKVKRVMARVKITYAADWSEYHHSQGGWYHLDPLWSSKDIDLVGIDAYFPLTEQQGSCYNTETLTAGWKSGEGYDWYYDQGQKKILTPEYAWKNIEYWWSHPHVNPDGTPTPWLAKSKPIWFIEYGFPSIDSASNQPNIFYNPDAIEGGWPKYSNGAIDFQAQRAAISATLQFWQDSKMVENMFLWCYDARPYPFWPDFAYLWQDAKLWGYGHWVNGKLNLCSLGAVITDICLKAGLKDEDIDASQLDGLSLDGYAITDQLSARVVMEELQQAYFFDPVEADGKLNFITNNHQPSGEINPGQLVLQDNLPSLTVKIKDHLQYPSRIELIFINKQNLYEQGLQTACSSIGSTKSMTINLSLVLDKIQAKRLAELILAKIWSSGSSYHFILPIKYAYLTIGDIIKFKDQFMQIIKITFAPVKMIEITAVSYEAVERINRVALAKNHPRNGLGRLHISSLDPVEGSSENNTITEQQVLAQQ